MLLGLIKELPPTVLTQYGGRPYGGQKPVTEGTGQAKACPARPAIESDSKMLEHLPLRYDATAPSIDRVLTPGRGTYHDGGTLARGFQDGNLLWRSCLIGANQSCG